MAEEDGPSSLAPEIHVGDQDVVLPGTAWVIVTISEVNQRMEVICLLLSVALPFELITNFNFFVKMYILLFVGDSSISTDLVIGDLALLQFIFNTKINIYYVDSFSWTCAEW